MYKDSSGCKDLAAEQDAWLDRELQDATEKGARFSVAFSHIPPFIHKPTDPDEYVLLSCGCLL